MLSGSNLQHNLLTMIIRWRNFSFDYTADMENFYRHVHIEVEDQHLQKTIWRDDVMLPLHEYQLGRVTHGPKAALFFTKRTIKQLTIDESSDYSLAADILNKQLYVDILLGGHNQLIHATWLIQLYFKV